MQRIYVNNHEDLQNYINQCLWYDLSIIVPKAGTINSFYIPKLQTKIIDVSKCKLALNPVTNEIEMLLASEASRLWLKYLYKSFYLSNALEREKCSAPSFFCGRFIQRELVYFDIVGAYYQLYKKLWLDFSDFKTEYKQPLSIIAEKLKDWKEARNFVIGNLASNEFCKINGDNTWQYVKNYNKDYYNPFLLFFLNSLLHELASVAIRLGACYIATDCAIFPTEQNWQEFYKILNHYKIDFRCIRGSGSIIKFASYCIDGECLCGDKKSVSTNTYRLSLINKYIDNPIYCNDKRVQQLLASHIRPLKNINFSNSTFFLDFWSRISTI